MDVKQPEPSGPVRDAAGVAKYRHEALVAVLQVRTGAGQARARAPHGEARSPEASPSETHPRLCVLARRRPRSPYAGLWSLPSGAVEVDESITQSARRHLERRTGVTDVSHLEQLETLSQPGRDPFDRTIATAHLALLPEEVDPPLPEGVAWLPVDELGEMAFDHDAVVRHAVARMRAKLSYTNLGFALAPREFTIAQLRDLYAAALGHEVAATNLQRILVRRGQLEATGGVQPSGRAGGRPGKLFRFTRRELEVTDPFATLKP